MDPYRRESHWGDCGFMSPFMAKKRDTPPTLPISGGSRFFWPLNLSRTASKLWMLHRAQALRWSTPVLIIVICLCWNPLKGSCSMLASRHFPAEVLMHLPALQTQGLLGSQAVWDTPKPSFPGLWGTLWDCLTATSLNSCPTLLLLPYHAGRRGLWGLAIALHLKMGTLVLSIWGFCHLHPQILSSLGHGLWRGLRALFRDQPGSQVSLLSLRPSLLQPRRS